VIVVVDRSRRNFLKFAGVAAGTAAVVPTFIGAGDADAQSSAPTHDGAFVAWVKDPQAGEIAVLVGERELTVRDRKLAKRLAQAAARAQRT
jgi:TAT (twin-arginine translocation) pathway signal sequence